MKDIRRSRRLRLPRRRYQVSKPLTSEDDDESDLEHERVQPKSNVRTNQNANQITTHLFDTITALSIEEKQHQPLQSSSEQSALILYSINSKPKPTASSDDLTPLTITTSNTTPLTALTYSNTKQTEIETVKIDLTELSGTDTLDSSPRTSEHDQSLSLDRNISLPNIDYQMKDSTRISDTDTSMKSVVFFKDNSFEQELAFQKHLSCFTIADVENGDTRTIAPPAITNTVVNIDQPSPARWKLQTMTGKFKFFIGCSSFGLIAGILILVIIL